MIEYISGRLDSLSPAVAVLETAGIGYEINITLIDYDTLNSSQEKSYKDSGNNIRLYIHESIREDARVLFGFLRKKTRELFRLLIGVSGVGPNTARLILSSLNDDQLENAIATGNDASLKAVKGIGGKTAQRIIVDLKDKIKTVSNSLNVSMPTAGESFQDSLSALVTLGFSAQQSQKILAKIYAENPAMSAEQAIKSALKML